MVASRGAQPVTMKNIVTGNFYRRDSRSAHLVGIQADIAPPQCSLVRHQFLMCGQRRFIR